MCVTSYNFQQCKFVCESACLPPQQQGLPSKHSQSNLGTLLHMYLRSLINLPSPLGPPPPPADCRNLPSLSVITVRLPSSPRSTSDNTAFFLLWERPERKIKFFSNPLPIRGWPPHTFHGSFASPLAPLVRLALGLRLAQYILWSLITGGPWDELFGNSHGAMVKH